MTRVDNKRLSDLTAEVGLGRDSVLVWCLAPWKLPSLPLMWIPQNGIHNRLEFLRNSTGSWKSLRDSHSSHKAYGWFSLPGLV